MTPLNVNDFYKMIENVTAYQEPKEMALFYNTSEIKALIRVGLFENKDGRVVCGGIKIIDTITQKDAVYNDYIKQRLKVSNNTLTLLATLTFILCLTCLVTNATYPYYLIGLLWIGITTYTFNRIERHRHE